MNDNTSSKEDHSITRPDGTLVLTSPSPLVDKLRGIKKMYWGALVCLIFLPMPGGFAVPLFYLMIIYTIDYILSGIRCDQLKNVRFYYDSKVGYDELYEAILPVMVKKYGITPERDEDGQIIIPYQNLRYDILISHDNFMKVMWRMSVGSALFSARSYKNYKKNISAMGIIAYEIQYALGINHDKEKED